MCGICGFLRPGGDPDEAREVLERMTAVLAHRGPDDSGIHVGHGIGQDICLGHRRLSIIGLADGAQPMSSADGGLTIAYNGELYNHPQQRERLETKGCRYSTHSDTETFLHLYAERGLDFLDEADGMFALALWDESKRRLVLARDRAGIKPLFYYEAPWGLAFASELKSLLQMPGIPRELDYDALNHYLAFLYVPAPRCILKGIRKLLPGTMLIVEPEGVREHRYWDPSQVVANSSASSVSAEASVELVRERTRAAVRSHLLSDVQVGAFLSGGIDSSIVVSLMAEELGGGFPTFSIGYEGADLFDETGQARSFASRIGTDHHELRLCPDDLMRNLPNLVWQVDEPMADSSCLPVYEVSKLARREVKVVLSGDGADELFAGYRKYFGERYYNRLNWLPPALLKRVSRWSQDRIPESRANRFWDLLRQGKKLLRGLHPDPFQRHYAWALYVDDFWRREILSPEVLEQIEIDAPAASMAACFEGCPDEEPLSRMLWTDLFMGLPDDMLTKVDRMSMFHSLEVRVPFLDRGVVEAALAVPVDRKLRGGETKWVLREAFRDQLPPEIFQRPKHGFDVPIGEWFRGPLRPAIEDAIEPGRVRARGIFRPEGLRRMWEAHLAYRRDFSNQLWQILTLELWQRFYLDRQPSSSPPGEGELL